MTHRLFAGNVRMVMKAMVFDASRNVGQNAALDIGALLPTLVLLFVSQLASMEGNVWKAAFVNVLRGSLALGAKSKTRIGQLLSIIE